MRSRTPATSTVERPGSARTVWLAWMFAACVLLCPSPVAGQTVSTATGVITPCADGGSNDAHHTRWLVQVARTASRNHRPPEPYFLISLAGNPADRRPSFRIPVAAGSETILDVLLNGASGQTILTARLEPS